MAVKMKTLQQIIRENPEVDSLLKSLERGKRVVKTLAPLFDGLGYELYNFDISLWDSVYLHYVKYDGDYIQDEFYVRIADHPSKPGREGHKYGFSFGAKKSDILAIVQQ